MSNETTASGTLSRMAHGLLGFPPRLRDRFVLVEGPRGSGKTRLILTVLLLRALHYPGSRWLLARSTRTRLSQSVLVTLEEQVLPQLGLESLCRGQSRDHRTEYRLPNGSVLVPQGLDDLQRTQSAEYSGIYVSEAVEMDRLDDVVALAGSMRQEMPPDHIHQCIVDCNPGAPGHWLNQVAEPAPHGRVGSPADYRRLLAHALRPAPPGRWKRILTRHQDNPAYFDTGAWAYTATGQAYLETLQHLQGHLRRRWLDGEWVAAEGTVYPEFDASRHVITPFTIPPHWPWYVGIDPGYDHPTAILWVTLGDNGTYYLVDEIYRGGRSVAEHAADIHSRNAGRNVHRYYGDPQHCFSRTAQSPRTIADQYQDAGIHLSPWPRTGGNEVPMVESVRRRLSAATLKVFPDCTNTIREFQSWRYKRTVAGDLPAGEDAFEDRDNHAMDVVKGLVAAGLVPEIGQPQVLTETGIRQAKGPVYPNTERAVRILRQRAGGRAGGW